MKTKKAISILVLFSLLFTLGLSQSFSQENMPKKEKKEMMKEKRRMNIPDLTEEQKASIKELRLNFAKETKQLKNEMAEIKVHIKTLKTQEKANLDEINKQIDLLNEKRTVLEKAQAKMEQEIRNLLSEDQKLAYDEQISKRKASKGKKGKQHRK